MIKHCIILLLATGLAFTLKAQQVTVSRVNSMKITPKAIDVEPQFPGGTKAFYRYISKNIAYEKDAKATDMNGIVTVSMAIEPSGHVSEVQIINGVSDIVDREIVRVITTSPVWKPGMQHGIPIKVRSTFKIELKPTS